MKIRDLESRRMKTFKARIKLPRQDTVITAQVVAANYELARRLLIGQYGQGSLVSAVTEVR